MEEPSNETIFALLKVFREETKEHFKILNNQTANNTAFRNRAKGALAIISVLFTGSVLLGLLALFK